MLRLAVESRVEAALDHIFAMLIACLSLTNESVDIQQHCKLVNFERNLLEVIWL